MKKKILASLLAVSIALAAFLMPAGAVDGIDASNHQTVTSWPEVKSQTSIVYLKATEGATYTDPTLDTYARGAISAGMSVGFYHFMRFNSTSMDYVDAQAAYFYNAIKGYDYTLVPAVDVEVTDGAGKEQISASVQEFIRKFTELSGKPVMIYASPSYVNDYFEPALSVYPYWIAHYTSAAQPAKTSVFSGWIMWQWTSSGSVEGISGRVDLDRATSGIYLNSAPETPTQSTTITRQVVNKTVAAVQAKLNRLKISSLTVDGINGPKTKGAVVTFEKLMGLKPDGVWGLKCQAKYDAVTARPTLRQGSTGYAVRYVQYRVGATVDGKFGAKTVAAVKAFQRANGLQVDSIVGPRTWAKMIGA